MIRGSVQPNGDAIVPMKLRGPGTVILQVPIVVDTGFNEWLALPSDVISALALPFREEAHYTLADGSESVSRVFTGHVEWFGPWRQTMVIEMDGGPLLGMALLQGCHLGIDVTHNGSVEIRQLQT